MNHYTHSPIHPHTSHTLQGFTIYSISHCTLHTLAFTSGSPSCALKDFFQSYEPLHTLLTQWRFFTKHLPLLSTHTCLHTLLSTSHTERNFPFFGARIVAKIERKQQDRRNNKKTFSLALVPWRRWKESNNTEEIIEADTFSLALVPWRR